MEEFLFYHWILVFILYFITTGRITAEVDALVR